MGCDSSKTSAMPLGEDYMKEDETGVRTSGDGLPSSVSYPSTEDIPISIRTTQGLAFEVPLRDRSEDESLIKKHPPKRLQRLEDQQVQPLTHRDLEEKLAEAEARRQQILNQRIQSAKVRQKLKKPNGESVNNLVIESMDQELQLLSYNHLEDPNMSHQL